MQLSRPNADDQQASAAYHPVPAGWWPPEQYMRCCCHPADPAGRFQHLNIQQAIVRPGLAVFEAGDI